MTRSRLAVALCLAFSWPLPVLAAPMPQEGGGSEIDKLREEYERKLAEMEERHRRELERLEGRIDEMAKSRGAESEKAELESDIDAFLAEAPASAGAGEGASLVRRLNEFNPRLTVFADFVGRLDSRRVGEDLFPETGEPIPEEENLGDRFSLRETELDLRADVDPYARGVFILALAEEAPDEFAVEIEEGYVVFPSLPLDLQAKAGKFRSAFGANNSLHTHDLPQTTRPLAVRSFLGPEGDIVQGGSLSWLVPAGGVPLELTGQVFNGENDQIFAGSSSGDPAYLAHLRWFQDLTENQFLEVGASDMYGYSDEDGELASNLAGVDLMYKWRPRERGNDESLVVAAEGYWLAREMESGEDDIDSYGAYGFVQYQPFKNWYFGSRWDWTEAASNDEDEAWSGSLYVSWYTTEFLRLRLGYEHLERDLPSSGADDDPLDTLFFELTWVFGSHPPHPYWVNR